MLPVVHLPYPLLRCTGILAEMGFSGLFLFYILSFLIIRRFSLGVMPSFIRLLETGCSVLEMFYFRYRASLYDYKTKKFTSYLKCLIYSCRFCVLFFPILTFSTFFYSIQKQELYKQDLVQVICDLSINPHNLPGVPRSHLLLRSHSCSILRFRNDLHNAPLVRPYHYHFLSDTNDYNIPECTSSQQLTNVSSCSENAEDAALESNCSGTDETRDLTLGKEISRPLSMA